MSGACIGCIGNCKFDEIGEIHCGFARVKLKGKYNYLTTDGKQVLPYFVDEAEHFTSNYGFNAAKIKNNGMCTLIIVSKTNNVSELIVQDFANGKIIGTFIALGDDKKRFEFSDTNFQFKDITVSFEKIMVTVRDKQYPLVIK